MFASDGPEIGTVDHVLAAPEEDIFHGIVVRSEEGQRFVAAEQIASLHERGVDLRIDAASAKSLPAPETEPRAWRIREPGAKPSRWKHLLDLVTGKDPKLRDWSEED